MPPRLYVIYLIALALSVSLSPCAQGRVGDSTVYDVVLAHGRIIDPLTNTDSPGHIGIRGGRIERVLLGDDYHLLGNTVIDVKGLVVSPGFIDIHAHGQDKRSNKFQVLDGVTTGLDQEIGVYPVRDWYEQRKKDGAIINFGAAVGHIPCRMHTLEGRKVGHLFTNPRTKLAPLYPSTWATKQLEVGRIQYKRLYRDLIQGLEEGGLGLGFGLEYTPGASEREFAALVKLAADFNQTAFVHIRRSGEFGSFEEVYEAVEKAGPTASAHTFHVTSSALSVTAHVLDTLGTPPNNIDVTGDVYPYTAASTQLESHLFDDGWMQKFNASYGDVQVVETGERLTEFTWEAARSKGGLAILYAMREMDVEHAVHEPHTIIASDGLPFVGDQGHPRGAGTFSRVLGRYVRERNVLPLMSALRKMTILPAQRLERFSKAMRERGRLQEGAIADITVFDPEKIIDHADYMLGAQASTGVMHVLVNGHIVVRDGALIKNVYAGKPIYSDERARHIPGDVRVETRPKEDL